jgi:basic membrane lipoprotein Med (substrate-binding protein (PBP1-ABC) superfamily)
MKRKMTRMALIAVSFALVLGACSKKEAAPAAASGSDLSKVKIGVLLNQTTRDGGWSQSHGVAFEQARQNLGLRNDQLIIMEKVADTGAETESAFEALVADGCNLIFGTSSGYTDAILAVAKRHPNVKFHQFEGISAENVASYSVRDYEAIFICGYVAARMSKGNALGFQAAQPQASVVRAINSWAKGAQYANPKATVKVIWTNSWYDPEAEMKGAQSLLGDGINVLGYHGSTTAVMQAAAAAGAYATGFHIDMHDYAPNAVLTSFVWNWAPIYEEFVTNYVKGQWTNKTLFPGIDKNCANLAPLNQAIIPADIIAETNALREKISAGGVDVFVGPLSDNKGKQLLAAGEHFSDDALIGMMYLGDNVIGSLP